MPTQTFSGKDWYNGLPPSVLECGGSTPLCRCGARPARMPSDALDSLRLSPKLPLSALLLVLYSLFFASFLQNEPNFDFFQHLHFKILPHFSVGFVW
jgi:hypothetical protein